MFNETNAFSLANLYSLIPSTSSVPLTLTTSDYNYGLSYHFKAASSTTELAHYLIRIQSTQPDLFSVRLKASSSKVQIVLYDNDLWDDELEEGQVRLYRLVGEYFSDERVAKIRLALGELAIFYGTSEIDLLQLEQIKKIQVKAVGG